MKDSEFQPKLCQDQQEINVKLNIFVVGLVCVTAVSVESSLEYTLMNCEVLWDTAWEKTGNTLGKEELLKRNSAKENIVERTDAEEK